VGFRAYAKGVEEPMRAYAKKGEDSIVGGLAPYATSESLC
jgi:hypothetical protein